MTIPTITALPTAPSRTDPATFAARGDAWVAALATFVTQANAFATEANAMYLMARRSVTGASTLQEADRGQLVDCSGTFTLGTTAAATLGAGWWCYVRNTGAGTVTLDPNAAETIDGQTSGLIYPSFVVKILCTGAAFVAFKVSGLRREVLTSGTSWVCQAIGVSRGRGRGVGAGAGGGKGAAGNKACGGGGAGAAEWEFALSLGTAYGYTIGAIGTGATTAGVDGGAGGNTTFNTGVVTITMSGGLAGAAATGGAVAGGAATNGDVNTPGGPGTSGAPSFGGDSQMGRGGVGASNNIAATGFGSGGFGTDSSQNAGDGRPGVIVLEY